MLQHPHEQSTLEVLSSLSYRTGGYLQNIAQGVSNLIGSDWSIVTLSQDGTGRILASSLDLGDVLEASYALHGTLADSVVRCGEFLAIEDFKVTCQYGEGPEGYLAYLGIPLRTPEGKIIGTISSFQQQQRQFTTTEIQVVELFAERAATAINNYQLYQQQQHLNQTLKNANQQLETEITQHQQMLADLRQSEARNQALLEAIPDLIIRQDRTGHYLDFVPAKGYEHLLPAWAELGMNVQEVLPVEVEQQHLQAVEIAIQTRQTQSYEHQLTVVGITYDLETRIVACGKDQAVVIVRDITDRKRSEREIVKVLGRLAEIGELAAMIIHEVRNPLTTVLMGLQSLQRLDLSDRHREHLNLSLDEADRSQRLLSEILLYAKPHAQQQSQLEINQLCEETLNALRQTPLAAGKQIKWIPATRVHVQGDKDKLKQVLINLINNACEAVPEGEIVTCACYLRPETQQLCIQVHNGGAPIPAEILPKLTQPFFSRKPAGNGLGLAIVKRIVEDHQGELSIQSSAVAGTIVEVKLPIALFAPS